MIEITQSASYCLTFNLYVRSSVKHKDLWQKEKSKSEDSAQRGTECNQTLKSIKGNQRQFSENVRSEDDLRSRIFGTFVVEFLACLPLLGFSNT